VFVAQQRVDGCDCTDTGDDSRSRSVFGKAFLGMKLELDVNKSISSQHIVLVAATLKERNSIVDLTIIITDSDMRILPQAARQQSYCLLLLFPLHI